MNKEKLFKHLSQPTWKQGDLEEYKQDLLNQIKEDLKAGKFYQICSNETTFKNYIKQLLK